MNESFSYQITATNAPTAYAASGLPKGLSVDGKPGLVSGVPTVTGKFTPTFKVVNHGGAGTQALTLTIVPPPPVISSATTAMVATGQAFSYQIAAANNPTCYAVAYLPTA